MGNDATKYGVLFIALIFLAIVMRELSVVLVPFTIALLLSVLIVPVMRNIKAKKLANTLAFVVVGIIVILTLLLIRLSPNDVPTELDVKQTDSLDEMIGEKFGSLIDEEQLRQLATSGISTTLNLIKSLFSLGLFVAIFLLFIIPSYESTIDLLDRKTKKPIRKTITDIENAVRDYLVIKTFASVLVALLCVLILYFYDLNFLVVFGFIFFAFNFIPNVGSIVAVVAAVAFAALTLGVSINLLWLFALLMLAQIIVGSVLEPKIAGDKLNMSPIVILFSLFVWGWMWDVIGMLLAVPLTSVLSITFKKLQLKKYF